MHDAALAARETAELDAEVLAVLLHLPNLLGGSGLADDLELLERLERQRRRRMIKRRERLVRAPHLRPGTQ